jgi:uncharacterized protein (TIGR04255 family)
VKGVEQEFDAVVTQALEPGKRRDQLSILLDIDVSTSREMEPHARDPIDALGRIHDVKNQIFFGSITERTAELCQ